MYINKILILALLLNTDYCFGQHIIKADGSIITAKQIDDKVSMLMDSAHVQGLNLAILNNNRIAYLKSYGFRNKPQNKIMDTATIVYGASFSKAVFGFLVMKLVEEKMIDLDKPLYQYLKKPIPDYEYFSDLKNDNRWKLITARMCLSHTTGLPNIRWFHPSTGEMDSLGTLRIYFTPGSKYAYSGEGFRILQLAIEEIMQKNVDELAQERIFNPFGMYRTGYTWHTSFGDENVAVGHLNNGLIDQKKKRKEPVAGGSLVTTIADYARFIEQIMMKQQLSAKQYEEMFHPQISIHSVKQFPPITSEVTNENDGIGLSYGLGWGLFNCKLGRAFFKEGNGDSWRNYNINYPDKGISVIILTNSENGETLYQELLETIVGETYIPWKWQDYIPYNHKK